jgi:hypothetical protein
VPTVATASADRSILPDMTKLATRPGLPASALFYA